MKWQKWSHWARESIIQNELKGITVLTPPLLAGLIRKAEGIPCLHANAKGLRLLGPAECKPREAVCGLQREIYPETPNPCKGGGKCPL